MKVNPVPYEKVLFVCINKREPHEVCCSHRESEAIASAMKARVKELGLSRVVRVSRSGCQDLCVKGPNVMVFPDYIWYHGVTLADVGRIVADSVGGLQPTSATPTACLSHPARGGRQV